jgi:hypothetical protein
MELLPPELDTAIVENRGEPVAEAEESNEIEDSKIDEE